jgi:hypothetical protein
MIDINRLKIGDMITFGEEVTKSVSRTCKYNNRMNSVSFDDGTILNEDNTLWRLARLGRCKLPHLHSGFVVGDEKYQYYCDGCRYIPEIFLKALKEDVATLEAAGVRVAGN